MTKILERAMLETLLTLLPLRATEGQIDFHQQFVSSILREYQNTLQATGYRDRDSLRRIGRRIAYSMRILKWYRFQFWFRVRLFLHRAWNLKTVTRLGKIENLPTLP
jgi:hypothetical protein